MGVIAADDGFDAKAAAKSFLLAGGRRGAAPLDVPSVVDDELDRLGYPAASRLSILGNVGRENAWKPETIFGGHADPKNQASNRGLLSWQGSRQEDLNGFLQRNGGSWEPNEDNLRLQTRFMDDELRRKYPDVHSALTNPDVGTPQASRALRSYISYVPTAPYNTPDPEYDVVNNRTWAEKAAKRGLGQFNAIGAARSFLSDGANADSFDPVAAAKAFLQSSTGDDPGGPTKPMPPTVPSTSPGTTFSTPLAPAATMPPAAPSTSQNVGTSQSPAPQPDLVANLTAQREQLGRDLAATNNVTQKKLIQESMAKLDKSIADFQAQPSSSPAPTAAAAPTTTPPAQSQAQSAPGPEFSIKDDAGNVYRKVVPSESPSGEKIFERPGDSRDIPKGAIRIADQSGKRYLMLPGETTKDEAGNEKTNYALQPEDPEPAKPFTLKTPSGQELTEAPADPAKPLAAGQKRLVDSKGQTYLATQKASKDMPDGSTSVSYDIAAENQPKAFARKPVTAKKTFDSSSAVAPSAATYGFEKTGELKLKDGTVLKLDRGGDVPEGKFRFHDADGETYLFDKATDQLEDDSLKQSAASFNLNLLPENAKGVTTPDVARGVLAGQIGTKLKDQYNIPASDTEAFFQQEGYKKLDTGQSYQPDDYFAKGDHSTEPFSLTRRDIRDIAAYSQKRRADLQQNLLSIVASGRGLTPQEQSYFKQNDVDVNAAKSGDDYQMAAVKGQVAKEDLTRLTDEIKSGADTPVARQMSERIRHYGLDPTDDFAARTAAAIKTGAVDEVTARAGLAAYAQMREDIRTQLRDDAISQAKFGNPTKVEQDAAIRHIKITDADVDKRLAQLKDIELSPQESTAARAQGRGVTDRYGDLGAAFASFGASAESGAVKALAGLARVVGGLGSDTAKQDYIGLAKLAEKIDTSQQELAKNGGKVSGALKYGSQTLGGLVPVVALSSTPLGMVGGFAVNDLATKLGEGGTPTQAFGAGAKGAATAGLFTVAQPVANVLLRGAFRVLAPNILGESAVAGEQASAKGLLPGETSRSGNILSRMLPNILSEDTQAALKDPKILAEIKEARRLGMNDLLEPDLHRVLTAANVIKAGTKYGVIAAGTGMIEAGSGASKEETVGAVVQNVLMDAAMAHAKEAGISVAKAIDLLKGKVYDVATSFGTKTVTIDKDGSVLSWEKMPDEFKDGVLYAKDVTPAAEAPTGTTAPAPALEGSVTYSKPRPAVWRNAESDHPVTVTGEAGTEGGQKYYTVQGSQTAIPENQLDFSRSSPAKVDTYHALDRIDALNEAGAIKGKDLKDLVGQLDTDPAAAVQRIAALEKAAGIEPVQAQTTGNPEPSASPTAIAAGAPKDTTAVETPREPAVQNNAVEPEIPAERKKVNRMIVEPLPPKEESVGESTPSSGNAPGTVHEFSSTQANLPEQQAEKVREVGRTLIPDREIYTDPADPSFGREETPHATVKYGIHAAESGDVERALANEKPFTAKLGKISTFEAKGDSPYDVVKADVESPELHRLNKAIASATKVTDTFPEYKPHVTLAYVKKGEGHKYVGRTDLEGMEVPVNSVQFSGKNGDTVDIPLGGALLSGTAAAHEAATSPHNELPEPTEPQQDAGNYKKGHIRIAGLDISIENPVGSERKGTNRDGKSWSVTMQHHYGYIRGTIGRDKDHVDVFVKDGTPSDHAGPVYVVDQVHPGTGRFDEHKVMLGFGSEQEARDAYASNYSKDWKGLKAITEMPAADFKTWVRDGAKETAVHKEIADLSKSGEDLPTSAEHVTKGGEKLPHQLTRDDYEEAYPAEKNGQTVTAADGSEYVVSEGKGGKWWLHNTKTDDVQAFKSRADMRTFLYGHSSHHKAVGKAVREGQEVEPEILAGYPQLERIANKKRADRIFKFQGDERASEILGGIQKDGSASATSEKLKELRDVAAKHDVTPAEVDRLVATADTGYRRRIAKGSGVPEEGSRPPAGKVLVGKDTLIRIPGENGTYAARYVVREASDVHPSHNPFNFNPNPEYWHRNDRHYDKQKGYQASVVEDSLPNNFQPDQVVNNAPTAELGTTIIDRDGNSLGGNSRLMKILRIYASENPKAKNAYIAKIKDEAQAFGIDAGDVAKFDQPVLLRELTGDGVDKQAAITDFNKVSAKDLSASEAAVAGGTNISEDALNKVAEAMDQTGSNASISDMLNARGPEIVQSLIDDGVFSENQRNTLVQDGKVTDVGKDKVRRLLLGKVFDDLEQMQYAPAAVRNNIERVIVPLIKTHRDTNWDVFPQVREAIDLLTEHAAKGGKDSIDTFVKQDSLVKPEGWSPEAIAIAKAFKSADPVTPFKTYAGEFRNAEVGSMFGALSPEEAFKEAFEPEPAAKGVALRSSSPPYSLKLDYQDGLRRFEQDRMRPNEALRMTSTPEVLKKLGVKDRDVIITQKTLAKVLGHRHGDEIGMGVAQHLPAAVHEPVLVFAYQDPRSETPGYTLITRLKGKNGKPVAIGMALDRDFQGYTVHSVVTIHERTYEDGFIDRMKEGKLRYVNKQLSRELFPSFSLQLATAEKAPDQLPNLLTEADLVKKPLRHVRTPDAEYAVHHELPYAHLADVADAASGGEIKTVDGETVLHMNEGDLEAARRLWGEVQTLASGKEVDSPVMDAEVLDGGTLQRMASQARAKAEEMSNSGYAPESVAKIRELGDNLDKLAADARDYGIVYGFDDTLPEEFFHLKDLRSGRTDAQAEAAIAEQSKLFQDPGDLFNRQYGRASVADRISEIIAKLATGQEGVYGWDKRPDFNAERTKFRKLWADGVIRNNIDADGNLNPRIINFGELFNYAYFTTPEAPRSEAAEGRGGGSPADDAGRPGGSETGKSGDGAAAGDGSPNEAVSDGASDGVGKAGLSAEDAEAAETDAAPEGESTDRTAADRSDDSRAVRDEQRGKEGQDVLIERSPVPRSGHLVSQGYDPATHSLEVEFKGGRVYRYSDVPPEKAAEFASTIADPGKSAGKFFAREIRNNYPAELVKGDPAVRAAKIADRAISRITGETPEQIHTKNRKFAVTMAESALEIGEVPYEPQTFKAEQERAFDLVADKGVDAAISDWRAMPDAGPDAARKVALGTIIAYELKFQQRDADLLAFGKDLTENVGSHAAGLVFAKMMSRLSPVFAGIHANKITQKHHGRDLTPDELEQTTKLADGYQEAADNYGFNQAALDATEDRIRNLELQANELRMLLADEHSHTREVLQRESETKDLLAKAKASADYYRSIVEGERAAGTGGEARKTTKQLEKRKQEILAEKPKLDELIAKAFGGSLGSNLGAALRMAAAESDVPLTSLDADVENALVKLAELQLIDLLPKGGTVEDFDKWIREATNNSLSQTEINAIHAAAYRLTRPSTPHTMTADAKALSRNRLEHARRADRFLNADKIAAEAAEKQKQKDIERAYRQREKDLQKQVDLVFRAKKKVEAARDRAERKELEAIYKEEQRKEEEARALAEKAKKEVDAQALKAKRRSDDQATAAALLDRSAFRYDKFARTMLDYAKGLDVTPQGVFTAFALRETPNARTIKAAYEAAYPDQVSWKDWKKENADILEADPKDAFLQYKRENPSFEEALEEGSALLNHTSDELKRRMEDTKLGKEATEREREMYRQAVKTSATDARLAKKALDNNFRSLQTTKTGNVGKFLSGLYNLPRAVMFAGDCGFVLAQGGPMLLTHPTAWYKAMKLIAPTMEMPALNRVLKRWNPENKGLSATLRNAIPGLDAALEKAGFSGEKFEDAVTRLYDEAARKELETRGTKFEAIGNAHDFNENFMSSIGKKLPLVRQTNLAYSLVTDAHRLFGGEIDFADIDRMYASGKLTAFEAEKAKEFLARRWVNVMTFKGYIPDNMLGVMKALSYLGSAPRMTVSAAQWTWYTNPIRMAFLPKGARAIVTKSALRTWLPVIAGVALLGYLGLMNVDPEDKDFMQIDMSKLGVKDLYINPFRILKEPLRLSLGLGLKKLYYSLTGNAEGSARINSEWYNQLLDTSSGIPPFWKSKLHPTLSAAYMFDTGKNQVGEPLQWNDWTPMPLPLKGLYEAAAYDHKDNVLKVRGDLHPLDNWIRMTAMGIGSVIGLGGNSYANSSTTTAQKQMQSMLNPDTRPEDQKAKSQKANQLERLIREGEPGVDADIRQAVAAGLIDQKQADKLVAQLKDELGEIQRNYGVNLTDSEKTLIMQHRTALKVLDYVWGDHFNIDWKKIDAGLKFATPAENTLNNRTAEAQAQAVILQALLRSSRLTGQGVTTRDLVDMYEARQSKLTDAEKTALKGHIADKMSRAKSLTPEDRARAVKILGGNAASIAPAPGEVPEDEVP